MKLHKDAIVSILVLGVLLYLTGCFISADFNISLWDKTNRLVIGLMFGLVSIMVAFNSTLNNK